MSAPAPDAEDTGPEGQPARAPHDATPAPDLGESLRQIGYTGRAGLDAVNDAAKALRILISADLSLARSAFGRALAFTGVAVAFGASAWMLLMATLTAVLHDFMGWSWLLSLVVSAGLSLVGTALGTWRALRYFEHTRLQATRRQLARLGIGELADFMPAPGSGESAEDAGERVADADAKNGKPIKKGLGVDVTPP